MNTWTIEYDNDTGTSDECYVEWWRVTNGKTSFKRSMNTWPHFDDLVSVEKWDRTEHPRNRIGTPARVVKVETGKHSETGTMVTVIGTSGKSIRVDMNWLRPYCMTEKQLSK